MNIKPYRILLVDDHPIVLRGLRVLIETQPGLEVCSEASTGPAAIEYVRNEKPDLVLLDLTLPGMSGLDVARAVREESPATEVLVVTMHFSEELAREALRCGALGYVLKSDADTELLSAVDHARHHQHFFTNKLAISMVQDFANATGASEGKGQPDFPLTQREIEVVQLLGSGKSNKQVAGDLGVSCRTIESHRSHIMAKLNFRSFSDLIRFAVRSGIISS
jgi:DNA-binding NarL/FixJ family response regulator